MNNQTLFNRLNEEQLTAGDRFYLNEHVKECEHCGETKPLIKFYPKKRNDRASTRRKECIQCSELIVYLKQMGVTQ